MIAVTTTDELIHILLDATPEAVNAYSTSTATRIVLNAAIAAGRYATYTPPPIIEAPPTPTPSAFREALAETATWTAWAETLSFVSYTNLTIAAAQNNWVEAQAIYNAIKATMAPPEASITAWQALADSNHIPIKF